MKKIIIIFTFLSLLPFSVVLAAECPTIPGRDVKCLDNPLGKTVTAPQLIGQIIKGLLGVLGSVSLLMMVWGGFQWLISAGNAEKVEAGTKTMLWAAIGAVLALSSYVLVNQLTDFLHNTK